MPPAPGALAQSCRRQRSRSHRRGRARQAHRLWHARCAWRASAPAMPNKVVAVLGAGHSAVGTILDLAQPQGGRAGNADRLASARRQSRRNPSAAVPTTSLPRAASSARSSPSSSRRGGVRVETGFRLTHITRQRRQAATGCGLGVLRPPCRGGRADRRHRLPAGSVFPARAAHRARSGARMPAHSGAAHRSQPAQLRHRASAWRP